MRENEQSTERASALVSIVFPTPGKSSMIRCPSATRQRTTRRSVSSGARTTWARFATTRATTSAARAGSSRSLSIAIALRQHPHRLVEDLCGDPLLARLRDAPLGARSDEDNLVVRRVEADVVAADIV